MDDASNLPASVVVCLPIDRTECLSERPGDNHPYGCSEQTNPADIEERMNVDAQQDPVLNVIGMISLSEANFAPSFNQH